MDDVTCKQVKCCKCGEVLGEMYDNGIDTSKDKRLFCLDCNQLPHHTCLSHHNMGRICLNCLLKGGKNESKNSI